MKKGFLFLTFIVALMCSACGATQAEQHEKATPLSPETTLPADGVISKEQMGTIVGKDQAFRFVGESDGIRYTWTYQGKQIQNPVEQKLKLTFEQKEQELKAVKKAANNAQEALGFSIAKMELAGTPTLEFQIPKKWSADTAVLVRKVDGELKEVKGAEVAIKVGQQTTLNFRVLESGVTYYLVGGNAKVTKSQKTQKTTASEAPTTVNSSETIASTTDSSENAAQPEAESPIEEQMNGQAVTEDSQPIISSEAPETTQPSQTEPVEKTVTLSISAKTILNNWDDLKKEKQPFVPKNGWILAPTKLSFKEGESVYDILVRATREAGIQMESSWTPMYDAYYVEGINQLYEFDCGGLSGWMYQVNGWFPNYGCSKYTDLHDGDTIKWEYTCDLGHDLGAGY